MTSTTGTRSIFEFQKLKFGFYLDNHIRLSQVKNAVTWYIIENKNIGKQCRVSRVGKTALFKYYIYFYIYYYYYS